MHMLGRFILSYTVILLAYQTWVCAAPIRNRSHNSFFNSNEPRAKHQPFYFYANLRNVIRKEGKHILLTTTLFWQLLISSKVTNQHIFVSLTNPNIWAAAETDVLKKNYQFYSTGKWSRWLVWKSCLPAINFTSLEFPSTTTFFFRLKIGRIP